MGDVLNLWIPMYLESHTNYLLNVGGILTMKFKISQALACS
jgi:hypothetical protein